jgi:hypothetical protein
MPRYSGRVAETWRKLLDDLLALPEADRLRIATELLASVRDSRDAEWDVQWTRELDARRTAAGRRAEAAPEWPAARARIAERLGRDGGGAASRAT